MVDTSDVEYRANALRVVRVNQYLASVGDMNVAQNIADQLEALLRRERETKFKLMLVDANVTTVNMAPATATVQHSAGGPKFKSLSKEIKSAYHHFKDDAQFRRHVLTKVKVMAIDSAIIATIGAATYVISYYDILLDGALTIPTRVGKFLAGLATVLGTTFTFSGIILGIIKVLGRVLPVSVAQFALPGIGPLIATVLAIFFHWRQKELSTKQKMEHIALDVIQGATFFAISLLPPPFGLVIGILLAIFLGCTLTKLTQKQLQIPLDDQRQGPSLLSLAWRSLFPAVAPEIKHPDMFTCLISYKLMNEPVHVFGKYYEAKEIRKWIKLHHTDLFYEPCTEKDIKYDSEMARLIEQYKYLKGIR